MPLDRQQIQKLLLEVANTRDDDIDCDACLSGLAEFADLRLVGAEIPEAVRRIEAHLAICPECTEEFEVLLDVLRAEADGAPDR